MTRSNHESQLSAIEAFDAMRDFLEEYWKRGDKSSDDIAGLLGSLNRNEEKYSLPLDPALWYDWLESVDKIKFNR